MKNKFEIGAVGAKSETTSSASALEVAGCLHELFETQVDLTPDLPALISPSISMTYAELDRKSNQLAHYIKSLGVKPGDYVAIYFDRSALPILAILGALKAGVTYVPIDPAFPVERIRYIVEETSLKLLLTEAALMEKTADFFDGRKLALDLVMSDVANFPTSRLKRSDTGVTPADVAYVIYTSGTTGRPKGVMAEHRNAFLYALAFNKVCGTGHDDRVYQGFSLGFDGSIEEIWIAYSNGSALVVPGKDTPKFGNELGQHLADYGVTYFSTVPTLLSTISDPIPSLKTLVVSGEICPIELVNRWAMPGLRMLNVYGPTEATVNTTAFECVKGKPVTIGKPLDGYDIHILDSEFRPVARGESGELFVGGPTLARGYLNRPDLTADKFLVLPELEGRNDVRVYRTGDLVRWNANDELEFFGRIDSQVKIRGYRVELAEIESLLLEHEHIRTACVKLIEKDGLQELAAYVMLDSPERVLDRNELLARIEVRLPPYMVPGYLEVLREFPMLASGKVDRSRLPEPQSPLVREKAEIVPPANELEATIAAVWASVFNMKQVSVVDDFFLDLGGHSLMAAKMSTQLRKEVTQNVAIRDVYNYPTVRKLAEYLQASSTGSGNGARKASAKEVFEEHSAKTYNLVACLQAVSIYFLYGMAAVPFALLSILNYKWFVGEVTNEIFFGVVLGTLLLSWPVMLALSIAAKWLIVGRYQAGAYPLWGSYYFRWWLAGRFQAFSRADLLTGTPLLPLYFRAMGAKVGKNVLLDTAMCTAFDLISIGDETSIGSDTQLLGYRVEDGMLILGRVDIGRRCFVGIHSALGLNVKMSDGSAIDDQSYLPDDTVMAEGETRKGSPAQKTDVTLPAIPTGSATTGSATKNFFFGAAHLAITLALDVVLFAPVFALATYVQIVYMRDGALAGVLTGLFTVPAGFVGFCLYLAALKHLVLHKAKPGVYSVRSLFYLRKWAADKLVRTSKSVLLPLYTTMFLPHWMRLMGAKIGKRAELSVLAYFSPDLIELGEESFFADSSIVGGKRFHRGHFQIAINRVGRRSFVGNGAMLPVGASMGSNCLLGVTSVPPSLNTPDNTDWLGSPAFLLPHRHKVGDFDASLTFQPSKKAYAHRALIDSCRIVIPGYIYLSAAFMAWEAVAFLYGRVSFGVMAVVFPAAAVALGVYSMLVVAAIKKLVMGTFEPVVKPLWSPYVWLNEMLNGIYETTMAAAMAPYHGTPFIAPCLRLMGCKVGKYNYIESTLVSEFDLVHIGSYVALNRNAMPQNHLFEDRVMKSSTVKIEDECSIGNMAIVLYDAEMQKGSVLGPLSLVMKGESLRPNTYSHGIPTVQVNRPVAPLSRDESLGKRSLRRVRKRIVRIRDSWNRRVATFKAGLESENTASEMNQ